MHKLVVNQLPVEKLRGQRVFVRIDVDAQDATLASLDDRKLRASLPTLEHLVSVGAHIIIGTHLGDPRGKVVESLRLDPVGERLTQLLGRSVRKIDDVVGGVALLAVSELRDGDVLLLENLRFYPGEDANDGEFARQLGQLCDVYCNDSFALAHRATASTVGVTPFVLPAVAGLGLARELKTLGVVLEKPQPPVVAIVAGTRLEEKLPLIENLLPKLDRLFIGGTLAFKFLKAKGQGIGAAAVNEAFKPLVEDFLREAERHVELVLPQDFIVVKVDEFRAYEAGGRTGPLPTSRLCSIPRSYLRTFRSTLAHGPSAVSRDSLMAATRSSGTGRWAFGRSNHSGQARTKLRSSLPNASHHHTSEASCVATAFQMQSVVSTSRWSGWVI